MSGNRRARTYLFVPGDRPDRFAKAAGSGADEVLLDLEDAVAPGGKAGARDTVADWLRERPAVVRVNAAGTQWHEADLEALRGLPGLRGVVLPKALPEAVRSSRGLLDGTVPLYPLIESARGVRDAAETATAEGVATLMFGNLDFALDAGLTVGSDDERELLHARSAVVIAARAAGLPGPIDGVYPEIDDDAGLRAATLRGRDLGFPAKLCVHPRQVAVVHEALRPGDEELAWARRVLEVASDSEGRAVRVDGQMIDAPRLALARSLLDRENNP